MSVNMSTDVSRSICRPTYRSSIGRYVDRHSTDMSVDMSTDISVEGCTNTHDAKWTEFLSLGNTLPQNTVLRGCPCKKRPLDFRPQTEFLQIFHVRQLVNVINKNGNNLAFNAILQYFWRQFQRTVQNPLNRSVSSQI